jgi:N-hydroxyarylamine O-acetyltransferase
MLLRVGAGSQRWLADVGFGSGLLEPLPFTADGPSRQGGWTLRLASSGPRGWELRERRGDEWAVLYRFDDQVQHHADVVVANHFTSTWPRSPFVGRLVVVRKDDDALRELIGRTLTVTRPDGATEDRELGDREFAGTLREVFRLDLGADDLDRLIRASAAAGS